ncbi:MAG: hypothetical protein ACP5G8_07445 [Athalassotoga sp.]
MEYKEFVEILRYNNFRRKRVKIDVFALLDDSKLSYLSKFIKTQDMDFIKDLKHLIVTSLKNLHGENEQRFRRFIEQNHKAPTNKAIVEKLFELSSVQVGEDSIARASKILKRASTEMLAEWQDSRA